MGKKSLGRRKRAPLCLVCGGPLYHQQRGRPRTYCSAACRQREYRERQKWLAAGGCGAQPWRKGWLFNGSYEVKDDTNANEVRRG